MFNTRSIDYFQKSILFCLLFSISCCVQAQTTFNKWLRNIDSSISAHSVGWGCGVVYNNGHIYNLNSCWDSTGLIGAYASLSQLNDTGKIEKQLIFRADSSRYGRSPRTPDCIIKTLDNGVAFVIFEHEKYYNTNWPKTSSIFVKCNSQGDTVFTVRHSRPDWTVDSFFFQFERILQIPSDSSYILIGYRQGYNNVDEATYLARYSKNGILIWDTLYKMNSIRQFCSGAWTNHNNIFFSILNGGALDHSITWFNNYILKMDTSGQLLNTTYLPSQAMHGAIYYNRYSENKVIFAGGVDTLLSYVGMFPWEDFDSYELTVAGGLLDNQNRVLWRWLIPMDNLGGTKIYDLEAGKKLNNGDIIFYGSRNSNHPSSGVWGAWLTRTDSIGNMLWDRVYTVKEALHPETDNIYMSDVCEADNGDIILTGTEMQLNDVQHAWTLRVGSDGNISPTDSGYVGTDIYGNYPYIRIFQNFSYPDATIEVGLLAKEELKLFPNPVSNKLYVMYNVHENSELIIYDLLGKPFLRRLISNSNNQVELDVSELPCGDYLLVLSSGNKNVSKKFIKR